MVIESIWKFGIIAIEISAVTVPLYKGKVERTKSKDYKGYCLFIKHD